MKVVFLKHKLVWMGKNRRGDSSQTFTKCLLLFLCVWYMLVFMCGGTCVYVCVWMESRDWHLASSSIILHVTYWGRVSHLNPELADLADLVSHLAPEILFPLSQFYRQSTSPLGQHLHECYKSERWSSCMASTLPTEPSSQSYNSTFYKGSGRWMEGRGWEAS